jgi:hypothetical protein
MGIPTLIKTETASNDASVSFVDGTSSVVLDGTYDEYMFVFTDIGPATNDVDFSFQVNATDDAGGGYDTSLITSTYWVNYNNEGNSQNDVGYIVAMDLAQSANFQILADSVSNAADHSVAGIFYLFSPSSTTYVKHFYSRIISNHINDYSYDEFVAGYINDTTAIDEIQFKMSSGNFDGVIQMYGIS